MSKDEILSRLYRKHTSWVLMAERMMPLYYSMTAEDVVQEVYLKIYQELRDKKLKSTTIIIDGQPNYAIVYLRIRNIIADMMRSEKSSIPLLMVLLIIFNGFIRRCLRFIVKSLDLLENYLRPRR